MPTRLKPWLTGLCTVGALCATLDPSSAATLDFESQAVGLRLPDDTFVQSGFKMTVLDNFGQIDTAVGMSVPPTGDSTQFYFQAGDGGLQLEREDGGVFSLDGFSAAFVPLIPAVNEPTVLAILGNHPNGTFDVDIYNFAKAVDGAYPFASFTSSDLLGNLTSALIFACSNGPGGVCGASTQGNGQFAIDDIRVTPAVSAVPEPAIAWMTLSGLACIGAVVRRQRVASRSLRSLA